MSAPRSGRKLLLIALVCSMPWATALAHIGPSVRENNRYVKLTLLGNRVRLLYTFYVGDVPGRQTRQRMDSDRDGAISDVEAREFGDEIAATVAANLELTIDGQPISLQQWSSVDVGLGTASTSAGAFSVDLVRWYCLPSPADHLEHELSLFDHWHPPQAGETELRVEESPGVTVRRSRLGKDNPLSQLRFKWLESRPPHPLDTQGLYVELTVDPKLADVAVDPSCSAPAARAAGADDSRRWLPYAGATAVVILALLAFAIGRRRGS